MSEHQCLHTGKTNCMRPSSKQVKALVMQAERICLQRKRRFTDVRQRVLTLICEAKQPSGAYQLLEMLHQEGFSSAPPTVYRALDFLMSEGFIHRLASNNTYLACAHPQTHHEAVFLVCEECGDTQEIHTDNINQSIVKKAESYHFTVSHTSVEVAGMCARCTQ